MTRVRSLVSFHLCPRRYRRARGLRTVHPYFTRQHQVWYLPLDHRHWHQMGRHCCLRHCQHCTHRMVLLIVLAGHPHLSQVLVHPMIRPTHPVSRLRQSQVGNRRRTLLQARRSTLRPHRAKRHLLCRLVPPPLHRAVDLRASRR